MNSPLKWEVFISPQVAVITSDLPPGVTERKWSPISSTLISGERDAVLVDTFITMEQNLALAEWVVASGKNLTTIYATHGHGDHFFGVNTLQHRFPNARFIASRGDATIEFERRVCGSPPPSSRIRDLHRFQPRAHRAVFPTAPGRSGHCIEAHPALPCRIVRRPGRQAAEPGQSTTRHRRPAWLSALSRDRW